jgi:hypothetical protein
MGRVLLSGLLVAIAAAAGFVALGILQNLLPNQGDSGTGFYLLAGLPFLALCIAALVSAVGLWRR